MAFFMVAAFVSNAQPVQKAAADAFVVTRMAAKYHIKPRVLDESLSADMYKTLLNELDNDRIFLTQDDIKQLEPYKFKLHQEVSGKRITFLQLLVNLYQQRLQQADTMIDNICKTPFNFNLNEKYTVVEDTSHPANVPAMRLKLYKSMKLAALYSMSYLQKEITAMPVARQKKFSDSMEVVIRKKINTTYKRSVQRELNAPGGVPQLVSNEYCKALAACYDPHTVYMSMTDRENFESHLGRKNLAFGFGLDEDEDGNPVIDELKPGSPAFKSGMMNKGDKIISIQWDDAKPIDVSDASTDEIGQILESSNHAKTTITIKKADGTKREVVMYKEKQEDEDDGNKVRSFLLKGDKTIGYISLPSFYEDWDNDNNVNGCANDMAKEILKLKKDKIDALVLDLRFNGGGSVGEAVDLAGIFIDAGPITQIKTKEAKPITLKDGNRGTIYDGPLMLMVNGYSASASELLAGALQDYNRALIVGSNTYGKATGQRVLPLDTTIDLQKDLSKEEAPSYLKLTMSQVYRVSGGTAQFNGVVPDINLPDPTEAKKNKERDELFAIPAVSIDANKYYQPLKPLAVAALKGKAADWQMAEPYFGKVNDYIKLKQTSKKREDISLKLSDFSKTVADEDDDEEEDPIKDDAEKKAPFTVQENSFESQRGLKQSSDGLKKFLARDPYLKIVYQLALEMAK
jgi:carboxyl-terminal processing protease